VRIDLTGRTAIVTASTKGIGLATAKGFAAAGANVVINGRNQAGVDAALAELRAGGGDARGVAADLSTLAGAKVLMDAVPRADILVNSVFHVAFADFMDLTDEDWNRTWEPMS
jgi:NAD(P)-dependent dehydrogenase (short-subunit alcohol dehydrogenase family)